MAMPRLSIAVALAALAALVVTITYTGWLVVGVLADYLGISRFVAGLLLGVVFARFPWIVNGKPRIVGLLPKPVRRPLTFALLALCLLRFSMQGETVAALFAGATMAVVVAFTCLRTALFAKVSSSVVDAARGRRAHVAVDDTVIEGEFRERKE
ncbi:hypothetical protein [Massilia sp. DWR3-1-1]|uniref:hypothetical protein n=1 Tax=Massilia sp. DWR3-1-1 TaxID=2804559 RepID=UPI003CE9208C